MIEKKILDEFDPASIAVGLSNRVRALRIRKNLTQVDLAKRSGVSLGSIKRFETKSLISLQSLIKIALILDSADAFQSLFKVNVYQSIDDVISDSNGVTRKRARSGWSR